MKKSRKEILEDIVLLLERLADDWEYSGDIAEDTYLLSDMGFQSLEVVILSTATQERYGQALPFAELFAEIGQRDLRDISVGEWVDFVYQHLDGSDTQSLEGETQL